MTSQPELPTHWTMIRAAAAGDEAARQAFAVRYLPVVRAYLGARWRGRGVADSVDDAVQEVFVDCFRDGGALTRVDAERGSSFRAFLAGVTRNVALRCEARQRKRREHQQGSSFAFDEVPDENAELQRIFARAFAQAVMKDAGDRLAVEAKSAGGTALRRVALLRMRFQDGRALRDVAVEWGEPPALIYREFERARADFHAMLRTVVREHEGLEGEALDRACAELVDLLHTDHDGPRRPNPS